MSIDIQLYLLSGGLVVFGLIAVWQAFKLRNIYRSKSSWIGAFAFALLGGRQLYSLYGLKSGIARARSIIEQIRQCGIKIPGVDLDRLTPTQWLNIAWAYAIIISFVVWMYWQHRDLKKLGV